MCYTVVPYLLSTYERAPARSLTRFIYKHLEENILGAALVERASSITGFLGMGGKSRWWCIHECVIILYWCRVIIITRYRRHPYHTRRAQDIQQYERMFVQFYVWSAAAANGLRLSVWERGLWWVFPLVFHTQMPIKVWFKVWIKFKGLLYTSDKKSLRFVGENP